MKDSGVPWLGEVPEHWEVRGLRHLLRRVTERNRPDLPLLSVVREKGVILRDRVGGGENHNFIPDDLSNYKVVRVGQFAMNKMKAWQGSYGVSDHHGIVSPAYFVFDLDQVDGKFFHAAIRSRAYVPFFGQASDGIRIGQWDLSEARMREIPFFVPSRLEQEAILRFIEHVDRQVGRHIGAKQKLIKLLDEQKQTIINRAVVRGLDANSSLRPSGVEWLGDLPDHWDLSALRRNWEVVDCKHLTVPFTDEGLPLASVREAQHFELSLDGANRTTRAWREVLVEGGRQPKRGDLIYCRNVSVGAAAIVVTDDEFAMGQDVCLIRSRKQNQRWLNYFLHSRAMAEQLAEILVGSTFKRINVADIKALLVPVPPRHEQDRIVDYLDGQMARINLVVQRANDSQRLMREYRTRLIADIATGKLDVREAAAQLPGEIDEVEDVDEADETEHADSEMDERLDSEEVGT